MKEMDEEEKGKGDEREGDENEGKDGEMDDDEEKKPVIERKVVNVVDGEYEEGVEEEEEQVEDREKEVEDREEGVEDKEEEKKEDGLVDQEGRAWIRVEGSDVMILKPPPAAGGGKEKEKEEKKKGKMEGGGGLAGTRGTSTTQAVSIGAGGKMAPSNGPWMKARRMGRNCGRARKEDMEGEVEGKDGEVEGKDGEEDGEADGKIGGGRRPRVSSQLRRKER